MSQVAGRSAAFLEEMGVGAHWTLRRTSLQQLGEADEVVAAGPLALARESLQVSVPTPAPVPQLAQPPAAPHVDVSDDAFAAALADAVAPPRADVGAGATVRSPAVAVPVVAAAAPAPMPAPTAALTSASAQAPTSAAPTSTPTPTPTPTHGEHAADAGDDSMAWFDDAPAPARPVPVSAEAIAGMDWPALKTAISTCTRCDLCATRRGVVLGRGATDAPWLALGAGPARLDEKENRAITGDAGQLLDNMLKAIALTTESDVYVTNLVKCRPSTVDGADRAPTPDEVAACRPYLERELALTGAAMIVTFGQAAAKGLLGAAARGKVLRYGALPVVASYHPDDLLRRPQDKAKAWADLCLARAARDGAA